MKCASLVAAALPALTAMLISAGASAESLEHAWQLALERDRLLAAAGEDVESARSNERAARAARLPAVTVAAGYTRFDAAPSIDIAVSGLALQAPIFPGDEYASGSAQLKLPLYTGGRISAEIGAARQAVVAADEAQRATRSSLRLEVAAAYVDVLRAQRIQRTAESSVASLTAHVSDVANMVEREMVARSDLLAAQVALANAEQQRVRAANNVALAYAAFNRRLGEPLDRTPELDNAVPVDFALASQPLESLVRKAFESRSEIGALTAQAEALQLQSDSQRAALLPQLALSGGYTYFENEILDRQDFSSIGIGVSWNVFDGGVTRSRAASLRSASRAVRNRLDDLRSQVELQVRQAWLDIREARARLAASREAVAQSQENLRISRELYGAGLGTNTQVLDAVALAVAATNNQDNAALDESLSILSLARAVGSL